MNRTEFIGLNLYYSQEFVDDMTNNFNEEIERLKRENKEIIDICNKKIKVINEAIKYITNHREAVDERNDKILYLLSDNFDEEELLEILFDIK